MNEAGGSMRSKVRVYLLDDHHVVRRGLKELLEGSGDIEIVGESGSALGATQEILALRPDVALLDTQVIGGSGIDVCREVQRRAPEVAVLILTSYDDEEAVLSAFMAGAAGFLLKQIRHHGLIESVHRAAAGESLFGEGINREVVWDLWANSDDELGSPTLTPQETDVLKYVGKGLTGKRISETMALAEQTVQACMASLLLKLGLDRRRPTFVGSAAEAVR